MGLANRAEILSVLMLSFSAITAFGDGKVFRQEYAPKIETPDQRALIHFADCIERLVIETSIAGAGTNFAWVVPVPAAPEIKPVSETFFRNLQSAFRSRFLHDVSPYFVGVLFLCGIGFLSWRSMRDEISWLTDLPLVLSISVGSGYFTHSKIVGVLALALAFYARLFTRSPQNFGLVLFVGTAIAGILIGIPNARFTIIDTLGDSGPSGFAERDGVTIMSVQRAGVFDSATIKSSDPDDLFLWLKKNGFETPLAALPAIRYYVENKWVFVASKVRRDPSLEFTALHPLAFTFATKAPIYPARLTGIENGDCRMDLYIFGDQRASARHFQTLRCDRLKIRDSETLELIDNAAVGTKLSAKLTPKQMETDITIEWEKFRSKNAVVYSRHAATMIALNIAIPLAVLGWLLIGASKGGWNVTDQKILFWRAQFVVISMAIGFSIFFLLPKTEVVAVPHAAVDSYE